jgi:hypothetical protein
MKALRSILILPFLCSVADGATAYFAFQDGTASTATYSGTVTSSVGFASNPTIVKISGESLSANNGGQATFPDPNNSSNVYSGSGNGTGNQNSFGWNVDKTNSPTFTGAGFTVTADMTGLADLSISFGLRAAGSSVAGLVPLSFKSIEYSLDGVGWNSVGVASPTWTVSGSYAGKSIDLAGLDAIDGQSQVHIRFILADTTPIPTDGVASSIRIDNLVLNAVPEPSTGILALIPALAFATRRRR